MVLIGFIGDLRHESGISIHPVFDHLDPIVRQQHPVLPVGRGSVSSFLLAELVIRVHPVGVGIEWVRVGLVLGGGRGHRDLGARDKQCGRKQEMLH